MENHLHHLGYVNHFDVWVPHKWGGVGGLLGHIPVCSSLLKCNENILSLKQIVTADEKWILYNNVKRKRLWCKQNEPPPTTPKAGLCPKEVTCIWWDGKGVIYYEFLLKPNNEFRQVLLPSRPAGSRT